MKKSTLRKSFRHKLRILAAIAILLSAVSIALAQTDCADGNGVLDMTPPKDMSTQDLIQKFAAQEAKVREARSHYTFTQDVLIQTLGDKGNVDGQFHEITTISYDDKGKRQERVTYGEQSTLRQVSLSQADYDDIRVFMPWLFTTDELPDYNVTYAGQQHVDDLDTYVFHVDAKKEEKNKRYFQGRIWVDNHDFQIVKLCGKSVPDMVHPKKHQPMDLRTNFVSYRQLVDGFWFPAYARVDDTLHFQVQSVRLREIVKLKDYKKVRGSAVAQKPQ